MDLLTLFPRSTRTATGTEIDSRVHGIVKRPETVDYQTFRPEPGGLFDEEIFGPHTGEPFAANEIARSEPVASRFGVITLPWAIVHPLVWSRAREQIVAATRWNAAELQGLLEGDLAVQIATGELIESAAARGPIVGGPRAVREALARTPHLLLHHVLVPPVAMRPLRRKPDDGFHIADINDVYRRLVNRCYRLVRLVEFDAPETTMMEEERSLFANTVCLFDNEHQAEPMVAQSGEPLPSLLGFVTPATVERLEADPVEVVDLPTLCALRAIEAMGYTVPRWS